MIRLIYLLSGICFTVGGVVRLYQGDGDHALAYMAMGILIDATDSVRQVYYGEHPGAKP